MLKNTNTKKIAGWTSLLVIALLLIAVLLVSTTITLNQSEQRSAAATEIYAAYSEAATLLRTGSDALTDSARQYVLSGDLADLNAYFEEAEATQNRNRAIALMRDAENPPKGKELCQTAREESAVLTDAEYHAMKLRAAADQANPSLLPAEIAAYALTPAEMAASPEEQIRLARSILTDDSYNASKDKIIGSTDSFVQTSLDTLQKEHDQYAQQIEKRSFQQKVLLALFALDLICILFNLLFLSRETRRVSEQLRETAIIAGLTDDFSAVYYADPAKNTILTVKQTARDHALRSGIQKKMTFEEFRRITEPFLYEDDAPAFAAKVGRENLLHEFAENRTNVWTFRVLENNQMKYYQMKLIRLESQPNSGFGVLIGLKDVDETVRDQMLYARELEQRVQEQAAIIRSAMEREDVVQHTIIDGMATLVESRDMNTGTHIQNTQYYVTLLVKHLQENGTFPELADENYAHDITFASVLHDIGKIFISDFLLNKPGKLTQDEFEVIKTHTTLGSEIVDDIFRNCIDDKTVHVIRDIVRSHHEKWNGTGYPDGLKGNEIPLSARITAVADVFDALISRRSYKDSFAVEKAFDIIYEDRESHFDRRIADAFLELRPQIEAYLTAQSEHGNPKVHFSHAYVNFEKKLQLESIISGLVSDFMIVFYARPDYDRITILRQSASSRFYQGEIPVGLELSMTFAEFLNTIETNIHPDDRAKFRSTVDRDNIRRHFQNGTVRFFAFRAPQEQGDIYYEIKLIRLGKAEDESFDVLLGIHDISQSELAQFRERAEYAAL